ncbi:MAG TPA: heavy metal-binding domain-containing protein, partial [Vicinamibacterales bacterium]|nr:heavy metal-binding domain-containing protein [Vicinamibacterales bacterium]
MTPRTAAWIVLAGLVVIAGCQRGSSSAPAPAADATATSASAPDPSTSTVYMCPMDKDIRAHAPGKCPRCGMALVNSIPEPAEYHLDVTVSPAPAAGAPVRVTFEVTDPWKGNPVTKYSVIHEKLFHAFLVSEDLDFFRHVHPEWRDDVHAFTYDTTLPKSGMYRVLGDFYPEAATPQLLAQTLVVPGPSPAPARLTRDEGPKQTENMTVSITVSPETPVAGVSSRVRFTLDPPDG